MAVPRWIWVVGVVALVAVLIGAFLFGCGPKGTPVETSQELTMEQALKSDRPDLAVSEWLGRAVGRGKAGVSVEVLNAFYVDQFLREVNSGGFLGFFAWAGEDAEATVGSLRAVGLGDVADQLESAMKLVAPGGWPDSKDKLDDARIAALDDERVSGKLDALDGRVFEESGRIQEAVHAYIRAHMGAF